MLRFLVPSSVFLGLAFFSSLALAFVSEDANEVACDNGDGISLLQPRASLSVDSERWESRQQTGDLHDESLQEQEGNVKHLGESPAWKTSGKFDVGLDFPKGSPMPLMMRAVLGLVSMNIIVHMMKSVTTSYNLFFHGAQNLLFALEAGTGAVVYSPMLCTLFLAPWFRAMRLTGSLDPLLFELPQAWLEVVEIICAMAIILKTIIHIAAAYIGEESECDSPKLRKSNHWKSTLKSLTQGSYLLTNAAVACVVLGTVFMQPRYDPGEEMKAMSTSTANTMLLASTFFVLNIIEHFRSSTVSDRDLSALGESAATLRIAMDLSKMVPMLCLLFQAAGMHALEQDPPAGQPPVVIRNAMDVAAYAHFSAMAVQFGCYLFPDAAAMHTGGRGMALFVLRTGLRLVVFLAAFCVCGSVWADPKLHHRKKSPNSFYDDPFDPFDMAVFASDMVLSVVLIATLFMSAHLVSWIAELFGPTPRSKRISAAVAKALDICPTVAVLVVVLRLRSLQLSAGLGEPEARVEICMYLAFLGLLGRLFCGTIGAAISRLEDMDVPEQVPEVDRSEHRGICSSFINGVISPMHLACTALLYVSVLVMLIGCIYMEKSNMQELARPFGKFKHAAESSF